MSTSPPSVAQGVNSVGGLAFSGAFDSGRLGRVRCVEPDCFEVTLLADGEEDGVAANDYRVWYFFSVAGGAPGRTVRITIANLNVIAKVYNRDLRPLVRVLARSPTWERLEQRCGCVRGEEEGEEGRGALVGVERGNDSAPRA